MQFSFTRIGPGNANEAWGVRVTSEELNGAIAFVNQAVTVSTRRGQDKEVELGAMIEARDGGRVAIYAQAPKDGPSELGPNSAVALMAIAMTLHKGDWSLATLDAVADIVIAYGMPVTKPARNGKAKA